MSIDIKKLNPWNWFKHEEEENKNKTGTLGFGQDQARNLPDLPGISRTGNSPFFQMQKEFDNLMERMASQMSGYGFLKGNDNSPAFKPEVDIHENQKAYTVSVDIPGVNKDDISVEIVDNALVIKGEKSAQEKSENKESGYHKIERNYGYFQRVLDLPDNADHDEVQADFKNGVLHISIKKEENEETSGRGKNIPINSAA